MIDFKALMTYRGGC